MDKKHQVTREKALALAQKHLDNAQARGFEFVHVTEAVSPDGIPMILAILSQKPLSTTMEHSASMMSMEVHRLLELIANGGPEIAIVQNPEPGTDDPDGTPPIRLR